MNHDCSKSFFSIAIPEDAISDNEPRDDNPDERISRKYLKLICTLKSPWYVVVLLHCIIIINL